MKLCSKCGKGGPFHTRPNGKEYPHCKKCQNEYTKDHYRRNKAVYVAKALRRAEALYANIIVPSKDMPCADCGNRFPTCCMDFDHARGKKKFDIASGYRMYAISAVMKEIAKCDVVCANCHRMRTAKRILMGD